MCPKGPYQDQIVSRCARDPGLRLRDTKNNGILFNRDVSRTRIISLRDGRAVQLQDLNSASELRQYLSTQPTLGKKGSARTIYLVEGLCSPIVDVLGSHFDIDPSFFMRHERTSIFNHDHYMVNDLPLLPSLLDPKDQFCLKYYEVIHFQDKIEDFRLFCAITGRHIGVTRMMGMDNPVAVARRKCSFWSRKAGAGGWDGMCSIGVVIAILTDTSLASGDPLRSPHRQCQYRFQISFQNNSSLERPMARRICGLRKTIRYTDQSSCRSS